MALAFGDRIARAGYPGAILHVKTQQSHCPTAAEPLQGKSWVAGNKGSLQFDIAIPGVQGVPGSPVDIVLHYASGGDNQGTYGSPIEMSVQYEHRPDAACQSPTSNYAPIDWNAGEVDFRPSDVGGGESGTEATAFKVGFGVPASSVGNPTDNVPCYASRTFPRPLGPTRPVPAESSTQASYTRTAFASPQTCPPPSSMIPAAVAGLYAVQPGMTMNILDGATVVPVDHGYGEVPNCVERMPLYVEARADANIAKMGTNWSHSFAWHLSRHGWVPTGGTLAGHMIVLHDPRGGWRMFRENNNQGPGEVLEELPASGCGCSETKLYKSARVATPSLPAYTTYELVDKGGKRVVFHDSGLPGVSLGRLIRIEEVEGRNPIVLTYINDFLSSIRDAAGFVTTLGYDDQSSLGLRLTTITQPGGRVTRIAYNTGRVAVIWDPAQNGGFPLGRATTFVYGSNLPNDNAFADITEKHLPDGEVSAYEYYPVDHPNAGKVNRAKALGFANVVVHQLQYVYSSADSMSQGELGSWTEVIPNDPTSAPIIRQEYTRDGALAATAEICTVNCGPSGATVIKEIIKPDEFGRPKTIIRFPTTSRDGMPGTERQVTCIDRNAAGDVIRVRGPVCTSSAYPGELMDRWDSPITCEDDVNPTSDADGVTCPATEITWEIEGSPNTPSPLFNQEVHVATRIVPASERPVGAGGGGGLQGFRSVYSHAWEPIDGPHPRFTLRYLCPPHADGIDPADPAAECTEFTYETLTVNDEPVVRLAAVTDPLGATWMLGYDAANLLKSSTDPLGNITRFANDPGTGFLDSVTAPGDLTTSYVRNARGQVIRETNPGDQGTAGSTGYSYSHDGRLRRVVDLKRPTLSPIDGDARIAWWFGYDDLGGALQVIKRGSGTHVDGVILTPSQQSSDEIAATIYEMRDPTADPNLRLGFVSPGPLDPNYGVRYTYNGFGDLASVDVKNSSFDTVIDECYTVDPRLHVLESVEFGIPVGVPLPTTGCGGPNYPAIERFTSDVAGRLTEEQLDVAFTVDDTFRHEASRRYDAFGRTASTKSSVSWRHLDVFGSDMSLQQVEDFSYDASQRLSGLTLSHGIDIIADYTPTYDAAGRLATWHESVQDSLLERGYRANGQIKSITNSRLVPGDPWSLAPTGKSYVFEYDDRLLVQRVSRFDVDPPGSLSDFRQFDYEHDDLGRLRRAKLLGIILGAAPLHDESFAYTSTDDWSIASITDNLGVQPTKTFTYDDHDRITAQTPGAPPAYDPVGNITNDGQRAMTWDLRGRLTTMDLNGTAAPPVAFNSYDPFGRLIAQKIGFAPAAFHLWDGWTQVGEFVSGSGASGGAGTFRLAPGPVGMLGHRNMPSGAFVEYGFDHQQSRVSQTEGAPIYDAFGGIIDGGAALDSPIGFQGQEWRAESSLYYMRHRWYDPESARFMSRDPVISGRLSNYDFVGGDPVGRRDPMGLYELEISPSVNADDGWKKTMSNRVAKRMADISQKYTDCPGCPTKESMGLDAEDFLPDTPGLKIRIATTDDIHAFSRQHAWACGAFDPAMPDLLLLNEAVFRSPRMLPLVPLLHELMHKAHPDMDEKAVERLVDDCWGEGSANQCVVFQ